MVFLSEWSCSDVMDVLVVLDKKNLDVSLTVDAVTVLMAITYKCG